MQDIKEWIE